ncbi:hypothetical protein predicted by Glimmer/Critica [Streptococcus dysgalactiae subsp. equisimilis AC-2713]|uniref:Uncharacterized protein n=1 Tax=Streptococcus dysgalactiae subsp. equisimilis AC-2713 TaxID=759913 RepID=A0AB33R8B8_STREQ|nr:hypothetical protein predicted by Glimmer/Critica [Streptococcus dysgalactiae subsp. equisimilis AC-2713]
MFALTFVHLFSFPAKKGLKTTIFYIVSSLFHYFITKMTY